MAKRDWVHRAEGKLWFGFLIDKSGRGYFNRKTHEWLSPREGKKLIKKLQLWKQYKE